MRKTAPSLKGLPLGGIPFIWQPSSRAARAEPIQGKNDACSCQRMEPMSALLSEWLQSPLFMTRLRLRVCLGRIKSLQSISD